MNQHQLQYRRNQAFAQFKELAARWRANPSTHNYETMMEAKTHYNDLVHTIIVRGREEPARNGSMAGEKVSRS